MPRPSKKIIIILMVAILIVGGTFFFKHYNWSINFHPFQTKDRAIVDEQGDARQIAQNEINKDSDSDDLKDWEEKLWKTDPNNPDTDRDGTLDGAEVREGRDPTIPGPNDTMKKETAVKNFLENASEDTTNSTEKLSQEFFAEYLSAKQSDASMSDAQKEALIGNLIAKEASTNSSFKKYTLEDIHVVTDGSQETIHSYGNTLGEIIITNSTADLQSELSILQSAIANQDKKKLDDLDPIIARYQKVIDQSLKIDVPPTASLLHLNFINAVSGLTESISKMKFVIDDPLVSLKSLSLYSDNRDALVKAITDLASYFKENGVVFNKDEYGYTFRTGL